MFTWHDWTVVAVYLVLMVGIGLWASWGQRTKRDYFLGARSLPWWMVGLSIVAAETSALTFIGVPAMALGVLRRGEDGGFFTEGGNLYFIQITIGYVIARVIVSIVMVPHYFRGDVFTPYQVLTRAFGPQPRYLAAAFSLISSCLGAGMRIYVTAIPVMVVLRTFRPDWDINSSIVLFTLVALIYTSLGGITAIVWTDLIQFFLFFGGGLFAMLYIPTLIDGGWSTIATIGADHLRWFNLGLVPWDSLATAAGAEAAHPGFWAWIWANVVQIIGGDFNIWMGLVGATIGVMVSHGVDQLNVQRVLACKNAAHGSGALIMSALIVLPQFLIFLLVGAGLYTFYTLNNFDFGTIHPWDPTDPNMTPKADYVFPIFIVTHMPPFVRGLLFAGILAAAMSSVAAALGAISSVSIMDIYRPLTGRSGEQRGELVLARISTLVAGVVLIGVAYFAKAAPLIFNLVFTLAGLTAGALLGAVLFGIWTKSGYQGPVMAGMIVSFFTMLAIVILTKTTPVKINWPWLAPIGTAVCLGVAYLASYKVPKPTDRSIDMEALKEV